MRLIPKVFGDLPRASSEFMTLSKSQRLAVMLHKDWQDCEEAREFFDHVTGTAPTLLEGLASRRLRMGMSVLDANRIAKEDYFPQDFGKGIHNKGAWIRVHTPPDSEYTVPPFSIWYARPWRMDSGTVAGVRIKRAKIVTPMGALGVFPREFTKIDDISQCVGAESDGVYPRSLGGKAVIDEEKLFYLMSRGIPRREASMLLLNDNTAMDFVWFEMHKAYADEFGRKWPSPERCSFATPADQW